jgi:hypothetical protein
LLLLLNSLLHLHLTAAPLLVALVLVALLVCPALLLLPVPWPLVLLSPLLPRVRATRRPAITTLAVNLRRRGLRGS